MEQGKGYATEDNDFVEIGVDDIDGILGDTNISKFELWLR